MTKLRVGLLGQLDGARAGVRHDAPDPRRDALLARDLEEVDVAGPAHMGAAAELLRGADADHAHRVAVLLPEDHHGAGLAGLVDREDGGGGGLVPPDQVVHPPLHVPELVLAERLEVREVEAQVVGGHHRAGLLHVLAQPLAERQVEQVGGRVVGADLVAPLLVDLQLDRLADRDLAVLDLAAVDHQPRDRPLRVGHLHRPCGAGDGAGVAHLAARLAVERGLGGDHLDLVSLAARSARLPFTTSARTGAFAAVAS